MTDTMTDTTADLVATATMTAFCTRCDQVARVPLGGPDGLCPACAHAEAADHWNRAVYIARGNWRVR